MEPSQRKRQKREGRVKVNEYCGTKPEKMSGKGRESEGKLVLWNQTRGTEMKRKG